VVPKEESASRVSLLTRKKGGEQSTDDNKVIHASHRFGARKGFEFGAKRLAA
jgi:hypothetical protein